MALRAQEISQEAGSKIAQAMKDVINAAAGIATFAVESARDVVQYMVRRGQMTQEEADRIIREAEEAHAKRKPGSKPAPTPPAAAAPTAAPAAPASPAPSRPATPHVHVPEKEPAPAAHAKKAAPAKVAKPQPREAKAREKAPAKKKASAAKPKAAAKAPAAKKKK